MSVHPRYHPRPRGVCLDHLVPGEATGADRAVDAVQLGADPRSEPSDSECGFCWAVIAGDTQLADHAADCLWRRAAETARYQRRTLVLNAS